MRTSTLALRRPTAQLAHRPSPTSASAGGRPFERLAQALLTALISALLVAAPVAIAFLRTIDQP